MDLAHCSKLENETGKEIETESESESEIEPDVKIEKLVPVRDVSFSFFFNRL